MKNSMLKRASPTLLACVGAVGVVVTAVEAVRATPKAMHICSELQVKKFENDEDEPTKIDCIKAAWKCYIPTALLGAATIVTIFASNGLNKKQQASLASAYALLDQAFKDYRKKTYLNEKPSEDLAEIVVGKDENIIFYEEYYGQFFERSLTQVKDAEYELNKILATTGEATMNDFFRLLDLDIFEPYDTLGWSRKNTCDNWINFYHNLVELDDGMECCVIDISNQPIMGYNLPF